MPHDEGAKTPEFLSVDQTKHLITEADRDPIERDTTYSRVIRDENDFTKWESGESVDAELAVAQ